MISYTLLGFSAVWSVSFGSLACLPVTLPARKWSKERTRLAYCAPACHFTSSETRTRVIKQISSQIVATHSLIQAALPFAPSSRWYLARR